MPEARGDGRGPIDEQIAYYRARASEYDDWWLRRGRYDRGEAQRAAWNLEVARLHDALDRARPAGSVLELACGTGNWTERLARTADSITAIDAAPEALAINAARVHDGRVRYVCEDLFAWQPRERFDFVFFGFWLSHVPAGRFEAFWQSVRSSLKPAGRVFFVDSMRADGSTASDHVLPDPGDPIAERKLDDGRTFRVIKVFYEPAALHKQLRQTGCNGFVRSTGAYFMYGCLHRR